MLRIKCIPRGFLRIACLLVGVALADAAVDSFALAGDGAKAAENATGSLQTGRTLPATPAATVQVRPSQMVQLKVVAIETAAFSSLKSAIGQIAFNEDASTVIVSPFSGRVTKLVAKLGDVVERGSPLFEIDSPEVVQVQTDLIAAVQTLGKANSLLAHAQRSLARQTELLAGRATSTREHDQAKSDFATAESDMKTAESTLLAARNKLRVLVGRSEAEIERIEKERVIDPRYVVTSPIAGTIVTRKIGPGQYVRSDSAEPLFSISDLSVMWLKASVPEADIPDIRIGQIVEASVPALNNEMFAARITAIGAVSDTTTHRVTVRSEIPNPTGALKADMFASFKIQTGKSEPMPVVPIEAVIREGNATAVWIEREPRLFERRRVTIGKEQGNRVQILDGASAGERVVSRGAVFIDNEWRQ